MRKLLLPVLLAAPLFAAIGDNAPSVPATYVQTHPRLPYPDNIFLSGICTGGGGVTSPNDGCTMLSRYRTAAEAWTTGGANLPNTRYLLIAYAATKWGAANGHGPVNATYLTKIENIKTISPAGWLPSVVTSMAYDWFQSDICTAEGGTLSNTVCAVGTSASLDALRTNLYTMMTAFEGNYSGSSPYNDQFYITGSQQVPHILLATAIYPDDATNSLRHLRWSMDMFLNILLPAWKHVMSDNGNCGQTTDASFTCGGGWHEGWEYSSQTIALTTWVNVMTNTWSTVSGRGLQFFTVDIPWLKNFGYQMMYMVRPDWVPEINGNSTSRPIFQSEYGSATPTAGTQSGNMGVLDFLAAVYDDPTLRGWSRMVNWKNQIPDGHEPTGWPWYTPDSLAKTTNFIRGSSSVLATVKDFPGWGYLIFRSGWTENDTFGVITHGDSFWSHPAMHSGCFTLFNRGPLAIQSGTYRSGSAAPHNWFYAAQTISGNCLTITDPSDRYTDETFPTQNHNANTVISRVMPNGGGQRPVGSTMILGNMSGYAASPSDIAQWMRARWVYHDARLVAYAVNPGKYMFAAVDITAAYNNEFSRNAHTGAWNYNQANSSNRTYRAQKVVRQFLFIPRGTAGYLVVYDQIITASSNFTKKFLLHSINAPVINGATATQGATFSMPLAYTISRTETVTSRPFINLWPQPWASTVIGATNGISNCPGGCASATQYTYNGKLYGWYTWPSTGIITTIGGAGHEFDITDSAGTTNWNECMATQCSFGSYAGATAGPYAITAGANDKLLIAVDGGAGQTVTLTAGASRTCAQIVTDINAALTGAAASCEGPAPFVAMASSNANPVTASIALQTVANSAYGALGFTAGTYTGTYDEGLGAVGDFMHPDPNSAPQQPGSWRIEETIGANNLSDQMVNVMLATSATDTNVVSATPITALVGTNYVTTWTDNGGACAYSVTFPVDGVGGTVSVSGTCTGLVAP